MLGHRLRLLQTHPDASDQVARIASEVPLDSPVGRLSLSGEAMVALDNEIGPLATYLADALSSELSERYGGQLTQRGVALLESGAMLATLVMAEWAKLDDVPWEVKSAQS